MTGALRWRIMALQGVLVIVFGVAAGFLFYESNFIKGMIHDQLVAQQIYFPDKSQAVTGGALDPAVYPDLQQYAGQQVDNGDKAKAYGNGFIGRHLEHVFVNPDTGKGMTYAEAGTYISAHSKGTDAATVAKWNAQRDTIFKGESLRGMLLNAYGWWTFGVYMAYAAIVAALAAAVVFAGFLFEAVVAVVAWRRQLAAKPIPAGKAAGALA